MKGKETLVIGITGGIGSGKSAVTEILKDTYGALVLDSDSIGHQVMEPGEKAYDLIIEHFGPEIVAADGTIDRRALAGAVFGNQEELAFLNGVIHPAVEAKEAETIENMRGKVPFIALEAALLLEAGLEKYCDAVWYVRADLEVRLTRLAEGRGISREEAVRRMAHQKPEEFYRAGCQYVIDNSGGREALADQVGETLRAMGAEV